jgi:hypothetical protein
VYSYPVQEPAWVLTQVRISDSDSPDFADIAQRDVKDVCVSPFKVVIGIIEQSLSAVTFGSE